MKLNQKKSLHMRGFTLIEVLIVIGIIGIMASVALPSFTQFIDEGKVKSYSLKMLGAANLARSEAVKTNGRVRLCASSDGVSCSGSWNAGWIIIDRNDTVVFRENRITSGYSVTATADELEFTSTGIGSTVASITICKPGSSSNTRRVRINGAGRASVAKEGSC